MLPHFFSDPAIRHSRIPGSSQTSRYGSQVRHSHSRKVPRPQTAAEAFHEGVLLGAAARVAEGQRGEPCRLWVVRGCTENCAGSEAVRGWPRVGVQVMGFVDTDLAELLHVHPDMNRKDVTNSLCRDLTDSCRAPRPRMPKVSPPAHALCSPASCAGIRTGEGLPGTCSWNWLLPTQHAAGPQTPLSQACVHELQRCTGTF